MPRRADDARKRFLADGLAGKASAAPETERTPQQAKMRQAEMKSCNAGASAKSLKGADRKAFMSIGPKGSASGVLGRRQRNRDDGG